MGKVAAPNVDVILAADTRRLHRALVEGLLSDGQIPSPEALAVTAGLRRDDLPARLRELATADYVCVDVAGQLTCLYPFSAAPTPHVVVIGGQRRHAMCAIDALGIPAMFDREIAIEGECAVCQAPIRLHVRPGAVVAAEPPAAMVVARSGRDKPAAEACCPFTVFACGPAHARELVARTPSTHLLSLDEAQTHGETIFGDLLAEELPAKRRRSSIGREGDDR